MTTYHHPTIGAQQLQERADKVVIANATGNPDLFSEAVKDLLAAVRMFRPAPDALDDFASAGDNTLHGAIDHWQARAVKAEATLAAGDAQDWTPISEWLPEIPPDAPGKRIHVLVGRYFDGRWYSWSMWYGPRDSEFRFYEEFTDEDADGDDIELIKDDDCATHWRYMPPGPTVAAQQGEGSNHG